MRLALSLILFISSGGGSSLVSSQPFANCDLSSYYSTLQTSPLQTSRDDMHNLIKTTHLHELPYTSSSQRDVWDGLLATDTDITGQLIHLIYGDKDVAAIPYDSGSCDSWNREHIWSRSRGVGDSGADNTDLHHMRPADCNVNSVRSNKYFAQCGTVDALSSCTSPAHTEAAVDTQKDTKSFLPPASKRGDVARAILYMDLRYDGDDPNTENLVVSDCPEDVPNGAGMGYLSQLLQWHLDDPPDEGERSRNEEVCANWQGNRNPFVDYPELATTYFGNPSPLPQNGAGYSCSGPTTPPPTNPPTNNPPTATASLIITGVIDGPRTGGLPKAVELYATADIPDLSSYGVGFANNGGGSDGIEFTFPSQSATAGSFLTIASEEVEFQAYFGELPDFFSGSAIINGDDAIELFFNGQVIDIYGDVNVAGGDWNYMDGWSYRNDDSSPSAVFNIADWTLSGINAVDSCTSNTACASVFPFHSYKHSSTGLIITGVIDGPRSGGLPKAVELYATADIPDLSSYGVGFANNGGGTDGIEFIFPSRSAVAGSFFTISYEAIEFQAYFGVQPDFVDGSVYINGDDSIELFYDGQVIDVYGDVNVAGGEWNYMDGWSYRRDASTTSAVFNKADWTLSGINAVDSCTSNGACESAFPFHTYQHSIVLSTPPPTPNVSGSESNVSSSGSAASVAGRKFSILLIIFCYIQFLYY
mmetsp:Transcript_665/g.1604  ORF Transcript_665/g.1604 Transcript_665/m.1604 type:complete len:702 (-) Transcript_665:416-2521(-)